MHAQAAPSRRSPWAGLDALVLEEIEALRAPPPLRRVPTAPEPAFESDEAFLASALRYLAGHCDPAGLVARLSAGFQLAAAGPDRAAETEAAPDGTEAADPADAEGGDGAEGKDDRP